MNVSLKNSFLGALLLSIYMLVVLLYLNPFLFLENSVSATSVILVSMICNTLFITLFGFIGSFQKIFLSRIIYIIGILLSGIITSIICILFFETITNKISFISAYIVQSIFPMCLFVILFIYYDIKEHIEIKTSEDVSEDDSKDDVLILENNSGKEILNVKMRNIILFEANDNYVITRFLDEEGQLKKSINRISLKKIESMLTNLTDDFLRVHKSFILNRDYIDNVTGKSQAYKVKMKLLDKHIPVSRSIKLEEIK